jgi:hypothetical protein
MNNREDGEWGKEESRDLYRLDGIGERSLLDDMKKNSELDDIKEEDDDIVIEYNINSSMEGDILKEDILEGGY